MLSTLADKTALITGGSRGIGAATARLLSKYGVKLALVARNPLPLEKLQQEIHENQGICEIYPGDISDPQTITHIFSDLQHRWDRLSILINNAAILEKQPIETLDIQTWEKHFRINVTAALLCSQHAFQWMKKQNQGVIINVASISGIYGPEKFPGMGAYVSSKYALIGLTEMLALEGKANNIRVNAISPGSVDTQMFKNNLPGMKAQMSSEEIAQVLAFLAADSGTPFHGRNIEIY